MRPKLTILAILTTGLLASLASADVVINMPPPKKSGLKIVRVIEPSIQPASFSNSRPAGSVALASQFAQVAPSPPPVDVGDLALARYTYARTGTVNNYLSGMGYPGYYPTIYNNWGYYGWGWGWGWGWPVFVGGCPSPCPSPCK